MPRARNALVSSIVAHAVVLAILAWFARRYAVALDPTDASPALDLEFVLAAPPAPAPAHSPAPATLDTRPAAPSTASMRAHAALPPSHTALAPTEPQAPPEPAEPAHPNEPATPFLTWDPHQSAPPHAPPAHTGLDGRDLLNNGDQDTNRASLHGALPTGSDNGDGNGPRAATTGYVQRMLDDAAPRQIAGSVPYYNHLRTVMQQQFHPIPTDPPSLLRSTFFAPVSAGQAAVRGTLGPRAEGRSYAAIESLNAAHSYSEIPLPMNSMSAAAAATARTTRVVIELDQDENGAVRDVRILDRSGVSGFDDEAIHAVRAAVPLLDHPSMPGGWRSRWEFEYVVSRDPLFTAVPGVAGVPFPGVGLGEIEFDEATGQAEVHAPGRVHRRRRVHLISSRPIAQSTAQ